MSAHSRLKDIRLQNLRLDLQGYKDQFTDNDTNDTSLSAEAMAECDIETYLQICRLIRKHPELVHTLSRQVYPDMTDEELTNIWVTAKMKRVHQS